MRYIKDTARSVPFDNTSTLFTATNVRDAIIEAKAVALGLPRYSFILSHNGSLSNGQLVGYNNLVNNPIVIPIKSQLKEITFNDNNSADATFRFYKGTQIPGNLFYTWVLTSAAQANTTSASFSSQPTFNAGDLFRIYYDDTGTNILDCTIGAFFQVIE